MGWSAFETRRRASPASPAHRSNLGTSTDMLRVTLEKSRAGKPHAGSVSAKAEWHPFQFSRFAYRPDGAYRTRIADALLIICMPIVLYLFHQDSELL